MNKILDLVGIYLEEDNKKYVYKRILDANGLPNYYPSADKNNFYKDMYIDEVLFIPIEMDDFNSSAGSKKLHFGFRYLFNSSAHSTISLGPDPLNLGVTRLQLSVEIQRFRYYINENITIHIDKLYDTLHPPRVVDIEAASKNIGHVTQSYIADTVAQYNEWYLNRHI